jgi:SAM-dependent methyltransferase
MDKRKIFDTIPEKFDRWRPRYCGEAFDYIIAASGLDGHKSVLEIGPGTGQATEPILKTGCGYLAIELGEHLAEFTRNKFGIYDNFHIVNADFETYDFGEKRFDLVYSAAAIQWIEEKTAFSKTFRLLKNGGTLAMMFTRSDYRTPDEDLYNDIEKVYSEYFHPENPYLQKLNYKKAEDYGFVDFQEKDFCCRRVFDADEYTEYIGTHSDHISLPEPYRTKFFGGIRKAILDHGNRLVMNDTVVVYLAKKP